MSAPFEPTSMDRAWRRVSGFSFARDLITVALLRALEKGNGASFEKWLWRATPQIEQRKTRPILHNLLMNVMTDITDTDIKNRAAGHLMRICLPQKKLDRRESILIHLASEKNWDLLFTFGKTHEISPQEAAVAFTIFSGSLDTPHDQARALGWVERFGGDPSTQAHFHHREEFKKDDQDLLIVSILEYAMRYGDSTLVESVLDRLIQVHDELPSERFSGMLTRDKNNPLSLKNIEQLEVLGIAWGDVAKAFAPDQTPVQRATFLFQAHPYLLKLIPIARASLDAAEDAEILEDQTVQVGASDEVNVEPRTPASKPRRI